MTPAEQIAQRDMTDAELDALIAEQLRPENLPKWWNRDMERQKRYPPDHYRPRVMKPMKPRERKRRGR